MPRAGCPHNIPSPLTYSLQGAVRSTAGGAGRCGEEGRGNGAGAHQRHGPAVQWWVQMAVASGWQRGLGLKAGAVAQGWPGRGAVSEGLLTVPALSGGLSMPAGHVLLLYCAVLVNRTAALLAGRLGATAVAGGGGVGGAAADGLLAGGGSSDKQRRPSSQGGPNRAGGGKGAQGMGMKLRGEGEG